MTDKQQPEARRLADEWQRKTQREADRQNSAYDRYGMGNTPETVDPLGAKMAAELRRLHAENETLTLYKSLADEYGLSIFKDLKDLGDAGSDVQLLRMGYAAARLEIESLNAQLHASHGQASAPLILNCKSEQKRLATLWGFVPAQPAPQQEANTDSLRADAMQSLSYCHGLKAGWNFCVVGDDAGYARAMSAIPEALRALKQARQPSPAPQPSPASQGDVGPVATVQMVHGVTIGYLETAVPVGTKLYTAKPVAREPLTHAQAKALVSKYGNDPLHLVYQVEVAHGINKGGQHGTDT